MMCSMLESAAYNIRDTDDLLNPVGAGCLTGVIYKITSVLGTPSASTWKQGLALAQNMNFKFPQFVATPL